MKLNTQKTALTLGTFIAGLHVVWSLLVFLGIAPWLLGFIFWLHMVNVSYTVLPFTIQQAALLVIIVFFVGYVVGWLFASVWNFLHKK